MEEYLSLTLRGQPGEAEAAFKGRLTTFWTHMLRNRPDDYEQVYAEATKFERDGDRVERRYLVAADAVPALLTELSAAGVEAGPVDEDEAYNKYEAGTSEWFQLNH